MPASQNSARLGSREQPVMRTSATSIPSFIFCRTSKMSHDHSRRGSCSLRLMILRLHSIFLILAGDVTAVVVGSGALLGLFCLIASDRLFALGVTILEDSWRGENFDQETKWQHI